jgi:6-pyruvoyltetrahydropterin/6-carboxytetrahydropterin synthase
MYRLGTRYDFTAEHKLPFEEGEESKRHSHGYKLEIIVRGSELNRDGFLIDIIQLRRKLDGIVSHFRGNYLNEMEEMRGRTTSLENLAKVLWEKIFIETESMGIELDSVKLWENEINWISYDGKK